MSISFNQIPGTIGVPGTYVEFDGSGARRGQAGKPQKILVFGQMSAAKSVGNPNGSTAQADMPIQVQSAAEASKVFGSASVLARMATAIFKTNSVNEVVFVPQLEEASGVAREVQADYTTVYTAAVTAPGTEKIYIGTDVYSVGVSIGHTATNVASNLAAAINADATALFTAAASAGVLTLTAKAKGELYGDVQIVPQYNATDVSAAGAFVTFTQTVAAAGNPSVSAGLASVSNLYFTHVVLPYTDADNYDLVMAEAQDRWGPLPGSTSLGAGQDDFIVFSAYRGTEAQFSTFMQGRNSEYFTVAHIEPGVTVNGVQYAGLLSSSFEFAAAYAAMSAGLASVVANNPHQNLVLSCLRGAPAVSRFPWNVRNRTILSYGGATYKYNDSQQVVLEAAITERLTTDTGVPTDAERRIETQLAKSYLRWSVRQMLESTYPRNRLADDGNPGLPQNVATPSMIKGSLLSLCKNVWLPAGVVENFDDFKSTLIVERSTEDCNTIKFKMSPDIVNILAVKAGQIGYVVC